MLGHRHFSKWLVIAAMAGAGMGPPATARAHANTEAQAAGWHDLTAMLPAHVGLGAPAISPDSGYVVFQADIDVDEVYELYSVPVSGSMPVKLNPPLVAGGDVREFSIAPDSSRVVYIADQAVDERNELYSVPIAGGAATLLNGALVTGGDVTDLRIDGDAGRVVYRADAQSNDVFDLYSVPIESGGNTKLNPALTTGGDVSSFDLDRTGDRVVYGADQDTNDLIELYSVPISGGMSLKLNPPLAESVLTFRIAPSAAYVMFTAVEAGASADELFGSDTTANTLRKRNYTLAPGENVLSFGISPTAEQMVYTVGTGTGGGSGTLWRASPYSGPSERLSDVPAAGFGVESYGFQFTPDGERVVYRYIGGAGQPNVLQSARIIGGPLNRATLWTASAGGLIGSEYQISPNSQWVVFNDYDAGFQARLRAVPTPGGFAENLGDAFLAAITPDSQRVIGFSPTTGFHSDVHSVQIFGGGPRNLSRVAANEHATYVVLSPNGQWVVYMVQQLTSGLAAGTQLRASDGTEAPVVYPLYLPGVGR
jgi:Tol biopolymer transport system component